VVTSRWHLNNHHLHDTGAEAWPIAFTRSPPRSNSYSPKHRMLSAPASYTTRGSVGPGAASSIATFGDSHLGEFGVLKAGSHNLQSKCTHVSVDKAWLVQMNTASGACWLGL